MKAIYCNRGQTYCFVPSFKARPLFYKSKMETTEDSSFTLFCSISEGDGDALSSFRQDLAIMAQASHNHNGCVDDPPIPDLIYVSSFEPNRAVLPPTPYCLDSSADEERTMRRGSCSKTKKLYQRSRRLFYLIVPLCSWISIGNPPSGYAYEDASVSIIEAVIDYPPAQAKAEHRMAKEKYRLDLFIECDFRQDSMKNSNKLVGEVIVISLEEYSAFHGPWPMAHL
jgi:hypothetical protein